MKYSVNSSGFYGDFGGAYIPEMLFSNIDELKKNSVSVIHSHYESMLHGFLGMPKALSLSKNAFCEIGDWIYNFNTNNKKT